MQFSNSPYELAYAFDVDKGAPNLTCSGVPNEAEAWWAGFMSYPTFTAFVAPFDGIEEAQMQHWMDTFASICNFSETNTTHVQGKICLTSYFEASQAVIATMLMSGSVRPPTSQAGVAKAGDIHNTAQESQLLPHGGDDVDRRGGGGSLHLRAAARGSRLWVVHELSKFVASALSGPGAVAVPGALILGLLVVAFGRRRRSRVSAGASDTFSVVEAGASGARGERTAILLVEREVLPAALE